MLYGRDKHTTPVKKKKKGYYIQHIYLAEKRAAVTGAVQASEGQQVLPDGPHPEGRQGSGDTRGLYTV